MKIFVNARFLSQPVTGVQRYAIECSRKIKKLHPDTTFITPKNIFNTEVANELNAKVIGTNTGHLWEQWDLPRFLKKHNSPPLFNPCNTAPVFYTNNYTTLHDLAFYHHPQWNSKAFSLWYNAIIPRIVSGSRHLFTVRHTIQKEIAATYHVPESGISVTYNGIGDNMLRNGRQGSAPKENIILAVGSFNIRKNHHNLIKAFLASSLKDTFRLVIIGDTSKVFAETGIDEAGLLAGNIEVLRNVGEEELISVYRRASVVVSLSLYEGFGIPVLEGLFNGCKVVCSDIPVYRELYNGHAFFSDPINLDRIKDAMYAAVAAPAPLPEAIDALLSGYNFDTSAAVVLQHMLQQSAK